MPAVIQDPAVDGATVKTPSIGSTAPHVRGDIPIPAEYPEVTAVAVFFNQAQRLDVHPAIRFFEHDAWQRWYWQETARRVRGVAAGLIQAGVSTGDRVVLLSPNRAEWIVCDYAIQAAGAIPVPIYPSLLPPVTQQITENCGAVMAIVSGESLATKLPLTPTLRSVVRMDTEVQEWMGQEADPDTLVEMESRTRALTGESTATILYTSGTTGEPKGVVLTQATSWPMPGPGLRSSTSVRTTFCSPSCRSRTSWPATAVRSHAVRQERSRCFRAVWIT